ncbi:MAG: Cna B-type domain-containing protein [Actinobacteria bacterium]|nr:Cna B-type domain-containing protein [Actinomycetota bacterium]MCB9390342.1 Cna B-type domain-containing protein [Acidimicrobiia bacterium]
MQASAGKQRAFWLRLGAIVTAFAMVSMIYNVKTAQDAGAVGEGPIYDFCYDLLDPIIGDAPASTACSTVANFSIDGMIDPVLIASGNMIESAVCSAFGALGGIIETVIASLVNVPNLDVEQLCLDSQLGSGIVNALVTIDIDQILVSLLTLDLGGIVDGIGVCQAIAGIDVSANDLVEGIITQAVSGVDTLVVAFLTSIISGLLQGVGLGANQTIQSIVAQVLSFVGNGITSLVSTLVGFAVSIVDLDGIIGSVVGLLYDGLVALGVCDGNVPTPAPDSPTIEVTVKVRVNGDLITAPDPRLAGWEITLTPTGACAGDDPIVKTTNTYGVATFEDLDPNCTYDVEQTSNLDGYTVQPIAGYSGVQPEEDRVIPLQFIDSVNGHFTDVVVDKTVVLNDVKVSAPSTALSGWTFNLESDPDNPAICPTVDLEMDTNASGTAIFRDVVSVASDDETECSYTVTEVDTPDGYVVSPVSGVVTLDPLTDTSQVRVSFTNTTDIREVGDIDITKVIADTDADLEGWEFVIKGTGDGDCPSNSIKVETDENGEVTAENLVAVAEDGEKCDYTVTETPVDGWEVVSPASGTVTITNLDPDGESLRFVNAEIDSATTSTSTSSTSTSSTTAPKVERPTPVKPAPVDRPGHRGNGSVGNDLDRSTTVPTVPAQQPGALSFTG